MRRALSRLRMLMLATMHGAGAALSVAADHHGGAVRRGRADRRARAHPGAAHVGDARAAGGDRERHRRVRHDRHRPRRARRAGRLHAGDRQLGLPRGQQRDLQDPVRLCERFRAGRAALRQSLHHRRQERAAEDAARADRLAQGQSRQGDGGHRRRRLRPACRRRLFPEGRPARASSSCRIARAPPT